jgi:hypothetical protein
MTVLVPDGFDHYGDDTANMLAGAWAEAAIGWQLDSTTSRTGTHSLHCGAGNSGILRRVLWDEATRAGVAMAAKFDGLPEGNACRVLHQFRDAFNAAQISIVVQSTGKIAIYEGAPVNFLPLQGLIAESDLLVTSGGWNHIEAWVQIGGSDGAVEVRLNGVTAVTANSANTDFTGAGEVSQWASYVSGALVSGAINIDDWIPGQGTGSDSDSDFTGDFIGDRKVFTDFPDADTAAVDWVPSSGGSRFAMVDEADPDGDSTYDEAAVEGDVMGLSFPDLPADVISVQGVAMVHLSRKTDAGPCDLQLAVQSSGDEDQGTDRPMTTAYTLYGDMFETDPHTGLPWTRAAVNAMTSTLTRTS